MSLANFRLNRPIDECPEEAGIVLHDLQLDFSRQQAAESNTSCLWHTQLLETTHPITKEPNAQVVDEILRVTRKPWWSNDVADDGYLHLNLSKHLACAGQGFELAALHLDARWTIMRSSIGGILDLKTDFEQLKFFFSCNWRGEKNQIRKLGKLGAVSTIYSRLCSYLGVEWVLD